MATDEGPNQPPDEAFALLGDETRMRILQTLGDEVEPLSFSALRDRIGYDDPGNFQYHLNKLADHFVRKTDDGYVLLEPGRSVVNAVYSGAISEEPPTMREEIDDTCLLCGGIVEVETRPRGLARFCTECPGFFGTEHRRGVRTEAEPGHTGTLSLLPAGFEGRTPAEVYRAAQIRINLHRMSRSHDVCPQCSAALEHSVTVCESHETEGDGICPHCELRKGPYAIGLETKCTNCTTRMGGGIGSRVYGHTETLSFLIDNGVDPVRSTGNERPPFAHELISREPFEGRFVYGEEGNSLAITVDENLDVVDVQRE